jgi:raffinose/stachyose/melibiose transport system permease protein
VDRRLFGRLVPHAILLGYALFALFPIALVIVNSFKTPDAIFGVPYQLPTAQTFSTNGYNTVLQNASFPRYFLNSAIVTFGSLFFIVLLGSMAAFALSEYRFPGRGLLGLYLAVGLMIPIRLGTVSLLHLMVWLNLVNTLTGLVCVYVAMGLPLAIFILTQFMRQVPRELKDAARIDGASEYGIFWMVLPLTRPALGAIAVFTVIPIWNDLWFPLILAPGDQTATVTLGAQQFLGEFVNQWDALLAALTLSIVPVALAYIVFSKQIVRSLTAGALK